MHRTISILAVAAAFAVRAPAAGQATDGPTDAEIAHIAYKAGQIDADAARQALERSRNPEVRAFAETMLRDHQAVNEQALALLQRLGVSPADNATSAALAAQAAQARARLGGLDGEAFDRAYAQNEAAYHQTVNGALSSTLIPAADNAELKSLLESGLALFGEHQVHAEQLARQLR